MSDLGDPSIPDTSESTTSVPCGASRRLGDYVLLAPLGDDALGSVYRALDASNGHFVRLRILQSPELSPAAVLAAVQRQIERNARISAGGMRHHGELHIAGNTPYFVWPEAHGWTLDFVLARARAGGWGMPIEFALWIAEQVAAEIEQTNLEAASGEPAFHGALWPGFVSISSDAEVHVEGFGLAEAVLPFLAKPRMWRDVAPYIAPEVRQSGSADRTTDVFSIGVLLTELLIGQRVSADAPLPNWRADDEFSGEVSLTLRFALARPAERFASISQLHDSLKQLVSLCPFETTAGDLALFLYDLLNPESRALPTPFDGNSTNPVSGDLREGASSALSSKGSPRLPSSAPALSLREQSSDSGGQPGVVALFPTRFADSRLARWIGRVAMVAAAVALILWMPTHRVASPPFRRSQTTTAASPPMTSGRISAIAQTAILSAESTAPSSRAADGPLAAARTRPRSRREVGVARRLARDRAAAETLRLRAALARVEAERLDAQAHAANTFLRGRSQEQVGQRLLTRLEYAAARDAYAQALGFFAESQALSREERMRQITIGGDAGNQ